MNLLEFFRTSKRRRLYYERPITIDTSYAEEGSEGLYYLSYLENVYSKEQEKGYYEAEFKAETKTSNNWLDKIASGIYLYRLEVKNGNNIPVYNEMKKMLLIK